MAGQDLNAIVKQVYITDLSGRQHMLTGQNPVAQINAVRIYESMEMPSMAAEIEIVDVTNNLIATAPIVGTEEVVIELVAPNISQEVKTYRFVVYGIRNRIVSKTAQIYILDLFTIEALKNETIRIGKKLVGTGDVIARDVLTNYLQAGQKVRSSNFEGCKYSTKEIPSLKRPFDLITSMLPSCVSGSSNPSQPLAQSSTSSGSSRENRAATKTDASTDVPTLSGSAGYAFFETYAGYIFKSWDTLITGPENHREYIYGTTQTDTSTAETNNYMILNYSFGSQENILKKMRYGVYSSLIGFFNPSTTQYEEYLFQLDKEYAQMKHLGTDENIPTQIKDFSKFPSRIMLQIFDHETYYNGTGIANPTQAGGGGAGTQFPDFKKQWLAQSISRSIIMKNQILNITIPINLDVRAGDKLKVKLPNQSSVNTRKNQAYDLVNSGVYLVNKISYEVIRDADMRLIAVSNVELIRDNLGS